MNSDCPKRNCILTTLNGKNDGITRRNLLVITAKSLAGLALAPLSYALAGDTKNDSECVKIMASELITNNAPARFNSTYSSGSAICDLAGDITGDGKVDEEDLRKMASEWLTNNSSAISNLDNSFTYIEGSAASAIYVDLKDFSIMGDDWRKSCSACSAISFIDFRKPIQHRLRSLARRRFSKAIRPFTEPA